MRTARVSIPGTGGIVQAQVRDAGATLVVGGRSIPAAQARFEPAADGLVYGTILNDGPSVEALGGKLHQPPYKEPPKAPVLYVKPYNTHTGHGACVRLPEAAERIEVFAALGIVFAHQATRLSEALALHAVGGYTIVADLSLPQQSWHRPPIREKCFDGSCPIGPWVTDAAELPHPEQAEVLVYINGVLRQRRGLHRLTRPVARLIADVSEFLTLYPGDVLLTGIAAEAPSAAAGDSIAVEITGIGRLETRIDGRPGAQPI